MYILRCPHCETDIELVTATDLKERYSLGQNALDSAIKLKVFPEPALHFGNLRLWPKQDADRYAEEKKQERITKQVSSLASDLENLSHEEREEVLRALLQNDGHAKREGTTSSAPRK